MTLGKWVKKARDDGEESARPLNENERAELERLRKEVARLRMESDRATGGGVVVISAVIHRIFFGSPRWF